MKRKNKLLAGSLTGLLALTVFVYWSGTTGTSTNVRKDIFRAEGLDEVDRVTLASAQGQVALAFDEVRWRVNDAFNADRNMIDVLFATLAQAEAVRPVAAKIRDSVNQRLDKNGVMVSLYSKGKLKKSFVAGGNERKTQAYFREVDEQTPYVVVIPGYRVYVSGILEMDETCWWDKFVFGFNWRNFKQLETSFPANPRDNFVIRMNHDSLMVEGIAVADTARLHTFLDDVSLLTVDRYLTGGQDSLSKAAPEMKIVVRDLADRQYALSVYSPSGADGGNYPALVRETQPALVDRRSIQKILRTKSYFVKK